MTETHSSLMAEPAAGPALPVFQAGGREYSVDDVLAAAEWRGELPRFRAACAERWAAAQAAEAAGLAPEAEAIEAASAAYRYARDLVSAEECETWLAQRGLTFDDLSASVTRRLQAELMAETAPAEPPADFAAMLRTEALLADEFGDWARQLAWRVALVGAEGAAWPAGEMAAEGWAQLEARFAAAEAALAQPERRQRELAAQRLRLLRVEIETAEFAEETAAREAYLCVREDGTALAEVAAANRFPHRTVSAFLGELPEDWQQALLGAKPGDALPPRAGTGEATVLQLLARREPTMADAAVVTRLDAEVRRQHFGELETRHIRWRLNVEVAR